jgi:alkylation response protein AidB-like acyl-CoA dehydrogenase
MEGWPRNGAVFYDEVGVPIATVVGRIDNGWKVAMATLSADQGSGFLDECLSQVVFIVHLIEYARSTGRLRKRDVHAQLAELRVEAPAVR